MRILAKGTWLGLVLLFALALPAATLATEVYSSHFVYNYCGGTYNWTSYSKVRFNVTGASSANKLTIDSWVSEMDPSSPHWQHAEDFPRVSTTFTPDATAHHLTVARHVRGGVDASVRIVYKLQAWDHGLVAWTQTVHSIAC